ncbi:PLP-dependent aminotransferase family protein [Frateuria terrea]|uniref:Transcriptional regulator, GntR family n=1 Tax=Frateuria terrea TaxID=529704 RepID=A0A1H6R397_9GAMM|nr:PLP-dependent aminotransferase family protein [Frateuria terrea]SEI45662.1 transcriptional regulator, GntR family [Frateuria terrea]SFP11461.1 transcriptional regulator, GntR family [Frateuria terrea]
MKRVSASLLPPIALDPQGVAPIYRQLSDWFRRAIVDGQLQPGQRVPSTRALAGELKVSRLPVLSAYEQLHAEGYLETFTGAGTCVAGAIPLGAPDKPRRRRGSASSALTASPMRRVATRAMAMAGPEQTWLDSQGAFRVGLPALDAFPHEAWARLLSRHARHVDTESLVYGDPLGYLPLREAIADYLRTVRAVRADASQVMITTGAQHGVQVCTHVLLDAGDTAWVEEPGYPGAHQALAAVDAKVVLVPVDEDGLDVAEGIRRGPDARMVYLTPSHQFPLGVTMSASRRMQLLQWAAREGRWIVEDDYDSEYRFGGKPVPSLQGLDADGRVIYVGTFSKVMFPALRLGWLVVPKDLVPAFRMARDALDTCSPMLPQRAMTDFIREGHFARHIRRMRALYAARRAALLGAIERHLPGRLQVVGAEAGMQLAALLPRGMDDIALSRAAARAGVSIRPLSQCWRGPGARHGLILGYGGVDAHAIEEGIRRLAQCM